MNNKRTFSLPIGVLVAIPLAVTVLILYVVTGFFIPEEVEVTYLPSGHLTSSVFDAQNMIYVKISGLDETYNLPYIPYTVDVPAGIRASVGDAVVISNAAYYFYYNVVNSEVEVDDAIKDGLTTIISIDAKPENSIVKVLSMEEGFINGCSADFYVLSIDIENVSEPRYLCLYRLHINDNIYETDKEILLGCMATGYNTVNLANLQGFAEATVGTIKYDRDYAKKLEQNYE